MTTVDERAIEERALSVVRSHREMLNALIALRKNHRLSQEEIAFRMGVSQPTVAGFERYDSNPTLATIRRYAIAVGARFNIEVIDDEVPSGWERGGDSGFDFTTPRATTTNEGASAWKPLIDA